MYDARNIITRKNTKKAAAYNQCKVHVANSEPNIDKIVMLPLDEYVKDYKASQSYVYKGGHHASPVTHMRRGYYRRVRKGGDYIFKNRKFEKVENKQGNYCFVRPTQVNSKTDRVIVYQTSN